MARDYNKEYANYHSKPAQVKNRAMRNAARAIMKKLGKTHTGDKKDVAHKNGNPKDNRPKNLAVVRQSKNRSYRRTKTAGKLHRTA